MADSKRFFHELSFRPFQGESDHSLMLSIINASNQADQVDETLSLQDIKRWTTSSNRFDPKKDLIITSIKDAGEKPTEVGFSRLAWYTGLKGARLYDQSSFLHPNWRQPGIWSAMVRQNELRLQEIASSYLDDVPRFYQGWATSSQVEWISTLIGESYLAVRHFNNMLCRLGEITPWALPSGIEIHPVQPEHFRSIWEAQREVVLGLFEVVQEYWSDDHYDPWLKNPSHTPDLWQVAWDGDQVAGMVLNRIDAAENTAFNRKRGYTEHIFVRSPWRKRGLARALLSKSLTLLKNKGMEEAVLGVDTENESGAYGFYQRMGYQTFSTDIWFRKVME